MDHKNQHFGEFDLIDHLTSRLPKFGLGNQIVEGIGDDAAVINRGDGKLELITVDTLVENDHFTVDWSTPEQIGRKAMEVNVSDIAAMGGQPTMALVSLVINDQTENSWLERVYEGIREVCEKYQVQIIGGDTTHGATRMLSITQFGEVDQADLCLRSMAKAGDLICVTGKVGGSTAGYKALRSGFKVNELPEYLRKRHLEPKARMDVVGRLKKFANAMIDVSDGVGSEVRHIAKKSGLGAQIFKEKLPVDQEVLTMEEQLGLEKFSCALSGGEDFELLFTVEQQQAAGLRAIFDDFTVIGEMLADTGVLVCVGENGNVEEMPRGYDHTVV